MNSPAGADFENPSEILDTPAARAAYRVTDPALRELALGLLTTPDEAVNDVVTPNPHPGAAWWRTAGFGLFLHWGFHSVEALQPSWAAIRGYPYGTEDRRFHGMGYFRLVDRFDPSAWAPGEWAAQVHAAGFRYVVLTAKHHDGFALWPSRWGNFSTRQYVGRDLLRPYVEGLRAHGLKVGLYFSPRDWHYPGFPLEDVNFDHTQLRRRGPIIDAAANAEHAREFFIFTIAQLHELLTGYGPIDELWFDGLGWPGVTLPTKAVYRWIRSLQPQIVVNDRWGRVRSPDGSDEASVQFGDFTTHEWTRLQARPAGWWEFCRGWYGHWGYSGPFAGDVAAELEELGKIRSWDGNYLLNLGPRPDGKLPEGTEAALARLAAWMWVHGEAIHGSRGGPEGLANVPVTQTPDAAYLHLFAAWNQPVRIQAVRPVAEIRLLGQEGTLPYATEGDTLVLPPVGTGYRILKIRWLA
ncbi:MAG: alpha-L-fucosidase [Opitutaceae bacterium]|nr:alpha-L-fucosidase [Opitutaceae bacterium]